MHRDTQIKWIVVLPTLLVGALAAAALAGPANIPHTFVPGEVADANQMNANLQALKDAIDDNHARIQTLEAAALPPAQGTVLGYANVSAAGVVNTSWMSTGGTPTVEHPSAGTYQITWPGENVLSTDTPTFVTPQSISRTVTVGSAGGGAQSTIVFRDLSGNYADGQFWVMILQDHNP